MPQCLCGRRFSEVKYLRRHETTCSTVKEHSKAIWRTISGDKESNTKRRRIDDTELATELELELESNRFMGKLKGKKSSISTVERLQISAMHDAPPPHAFDDSAVDADVEMYSPRAEEFPSSQPPAGPPSPRHEAPKRVRRLTERAKAMLEDNLPEGPGDLQYDDEDSDVGNTDTLSETYNDIQSPPPLRIRIRRIVKTLVNKFGLVRSYHGRPSGVPKTGFSHFLADDLRPAHDQPHSGQPPALEPKSIASIIHPYPNISSFLYNRWHWDGAMKTKRGRKEFLRDVVGHNEFKGDDIQGINFDRIDRELAQNPGGLVEDNGWMKSDVAIYIPTGKKETKASRRDAAASRRRQAQAATDATDLEDHNSEPETDYITGRKYIIPDFYHRSLVHIIKEAFSAPESAAFHWHPFEEYWNPPWDKDATEHVYGDLFSSKAFLNADRALHDLPPEPGCDLPRSIAAMMFYSDATHVAQFGQAKLWPIYLYFGNQSKYERGRRSARAGYNVAFLPSLPDSITDFILNDPSSKVSAPLLAHCKRELFHGCWKAILDDDFVYAYEHGILVDCGDGVRRRIYPRIFIYSADYPEKVLVATIRDKGQCPCPRCKITKEQISDFGTPSDMLIRQNTARQDDESRQRRVRAARAFIYDKGYVVNSSHVDDLLKEDSLVPTENAFSVQLHEFGFNFFDMIVVDFMHEWEIGVWKSALQHLIRVLYTQGSNAIYEFNRRFRQVASFGRSTIRRFPYNVADLTKLAARDYEDILECCIPCFEGLLPSPHNETILDLLYLMNYWHSLAKLRLHTDTSLRVFRQVTTVLGDSLRYFARETCEHFNTVETDKEYQARNRATARRATKAPFNPQTAPSDLPIPTTTIPEPTPTELQGARVGKRSDGRTSGSSSGKQRKVYNLSTPKAHFFPDYPDQIELFGTTDCMSTQVGESRHTQLKGHNGRSNFNNATPQIINMDVRDAVHARMVYELEELEFQDTSAPQTEDHSNQALDLSINYHIARNEKEKVYLPDLLKENRGDPAYHNFVPCLKRHILSRRNGLAVPGNEPSYNEAELSRVVIKDRFIFSHATAVFNYTTYDLRRDQDTVNVNSGRRDIILPSFEDSSVNKHAYWYARVLGIYHANVFFPGQLDCERFDFLWVRWLGQDMEWSSGPSALRLNRLGYVPSNEIDPFGFLDPALVIRACHLIPAFHVGRSLRLLGPSTVRDSQEGDWENYYVNRFVDRDMMMRYLGSGVGHCQAPSFPREDGQLKEVPSGEFYIVSPDHAGPQADSFGAAGPNEDLPDDDMEDEFNDTDLSSDVPETIFRNHVASH